MVALAAAAFAAWLGGPTSASAQGAHEGQPDPPPEEGKPTPPPDTTPETEIPIATEEETEDAEGKEDEEKEEARPGPGGDPDAGWADIPTAPPRASGPPDHRRSSAPTGAARTEPRQLIDLDGREDRAEDGAMWIPRVLFFPMWVVTELLIRKPVQASFVALEEIGIISVGDDPPEGSPEAFDVDWFPAGVADLGFRPMVGLYAKARNVIVQNWSLRGVALTGGPDVLKTHLEALAPLAGDSAAQLDLAAIRRDDLSFWGIGGDTVDEDEAAFGMRLLEARFRVHVPLLRGNSVFLQAWMRGTAVEIDNGDCDGAILIDDGSGRLGCEDPTLYENVAANRYPFPSGGGGYAVLGVGTRLVVDGRPSRSPRGTGVRFEAEAEQDSDVASPTTGAWLRWGATSTAFVDITGTHRVISLRLETRFTEPYGSYDVPFTELVGGPTVESAPERELLSGFRPGRLLGESAAALALEYRWPVWTAADARLEAGVGNAFREHMRDFETQRLRFSLAGGLEVMIADRQRILLLAGFGTETFESGADPTAARIYLGGTTGL